MIAMAVVQLRPNSLLGLLFAGRDRADAGKKAKEGPSALRRLILALALVLGPLVVPVAALAAITIGAWQWSPIAGWIILGISLLWLDGTAGTGGPEK